MRKQYSVVGLGQYVPCLRCTIYFSLISCVPGIILFFFLRHSFTPELLELVLCEGSNGHLRQALLGVTARVPRKLISRFCVLGVHDMDGRMFARLAETVVLYFRCTLLGLPFDITMLMFMSSSFCLMATRASTHCSSSSHWVTQSPPC